ncbi:hypothetical protein Q0P08_15965, partial [Staphylococcus aureus]|nr:hypothetical protein [Staphylococcus aureus]
LRPSPDGDQRRLAADFKLDSAPPEQTAPSQLAFRKSQRISVEFRDFAEGDMRGVHAAVRFDDRAKDGGSPWQIWC